MLSRTLIAAAALAALAACDRPAEPRAKSEIPPASSSAGASQTPTTPANLPSPKSMEEKREGANPVQGQVDPKESTQRKDFQQKGDAAGPTSPETAPRR